jgi:molybdopterin-guanine dinucleotide biosynthesis protein A
MQKPLQNDATAFVLAGGQSTRMGRDKALLPLGGRPLISHALSTLRAAGLSATIAGANCDLSGFAPVIDDSQPGLGPLAGVCAALAATAARFAVFLSIDSPFLPPSLLAYLLHRARIAGGAIAVPSIAGFAQTFPAVIDRRAQPALQAELRAGRKGCFSAFQAAAASLGQPLSRVSVELLAQSRHVVHDSGLHPFCWFFNLNSPADFERAEALWSRRIA